MLRATLNIDAVFKVHRDQVTKNNGLELSGKGASHHYRENLFLYNKASEPWNELPANGINTKEKIE